MLFGTYIALQSGIAVNPYPTAPLKCVVIPQFADEDAQAERLTPECAKARAGTSGSLQHGPRSPPPVWFWMIRRLPGKPAGPRSFRGAGDLGAMLWNGLGGGGREGGLSRRWAHPDRPDSGILCGPRGANWVAHLPAASCRWGAHPKIVIIPNTYMLFRTQIKKKKYTKNQKLNWQLEKNVQNAL